MSRGDTPCPKWGAAACTFLFPSTHALWSCPRAHSVSVDRQETVGLGEKTSLDSWSQHSRPERSSPG